MSLNRLRGLLGSLENSRAKNRRGSEGNRRNPPAVKKPIEGRRIPGPEFRPRFTQPGGGPDDFGRPGVRYDRIGDMRIPEKGEFFGRPKIRYETGYDSIGHRTLIPRPEFPGFTQPGGGMRIPESNMRIPDRPISSIKEKPPAASTGDKGKDFEAMLRARMSKF